MELYIPEIGDSLKLTEDWNFNLYAESRNIDLAIFFGYYYFSFYPNKWINNSILPEIKKCDVEVNYPDRNDKKFHKWSSYTWSGGFDYDKYKNAEKEAQDNCPEWVKYWNDYEIWVDKCKEIGVDFINVTIPKDSILKVDRIYIRKGNSDYSSITFYVKNLGNIERKDRYATNTKTKKKSSLRFWVKLEDCNKIKCEQVK